MGLKYQAICKTGVILILGLFLTACADVVLTHPLPLGPNSEPDKRLLGEWLPSDETERSVYFQYRESSNQEMKVLLVKGRINKEDAGFTIFTTKIGTHQYMTLTPTNEERNKRYLIARYAINNDKLTIWIIDENRVRAVIKEGKVRGEAGEQSITITDTPIRIAAFLESPESDNLFQLVNVLAKVKK